MNRKKTKIEQKRKEEFWTLGDKKETKKTWQDRKKIIVNFEYIEKKKKTENEWKLHTERKEEMEPEKIKKENK